MNVTTFEDLSVKALNTQIQSFFRRKPKVINAFLEHTKLPQNNYQNVENLQSILNLLSTPNCLLLINNFMGLNFKNPLNVPVMLRRINYAFLYVKRSSWPSYWEDQLMWVPHRMKSFNRNDSFMVRSSEQLKEIEHFCPVSMFYKGITPYNIENSGYCVGLNLYKYVGAIKPWHCQVDISLFMPSYMLAIGKHTQVFNRIGEWFQSPLKRMLPSSLIPISILIDEKPVSLYDKKTAHDWLTGTGNRFYRDSYFLSIKRNGFIIGNAHCLQNEFRGNICRIIDLQLIVPCFDCNGGFFTKLV